MRAVHLLRKLNPDEWGGTETAIQRLCDGLKTHDVSPVIYCPKLDRDGAEDPLLNDGVEVQRYKAFVPVMGMPADRKRQLISVGGNLMSFDLIGALLLQEKFDLIHSHTLGRIGGIGRAVAKKRKVPFVVSIHGGVLDLPPALKKDFNDTRQRGWEWGKIFGLLFQSHRLFHDADAIITCNEREAALLRERHPSRRIVVHPHGVPVGLYERDHREAALAAFPQVRGRQIVLNVGRIDPVKNQQWLLEQTPVILQRNSNALIVLAGPCTDPGYGESLAALVDRAGIAAHVMLTGGMPASDPRLIGLMQLASVTVLCSVSETFGLILLEAWAAGSPVIASATSGAQALVKHAVNGWLFDLDQPPRFHEALDRVLSDPTQARAMAANGKQMVSTQYSVNAVAGRMKDLYLDLITERASVCAT